MTFKVCVTSIDVYYIRKLVSLYNSIDLNWSIFFDIGCIKIHVKGYRVCKQNRTTFVLLLFTMMTLRTKNPIIPAFSWRHNVFINLNLNLASILTLFLHDQSIHIIEHVIRILSRWPFCQKPFLDKIMQMKICRCSQIYDWKSFEYTFFLRVSLRNVSGNNWFTFVLNFNFCLFNKDVIF